MAAIIIHGGVASSDVIAESAEINGIRGKEPNPNINKRSTARGIFGRLRRYRLSLMLVRFVPRRFLHGL